jgi:diguanylate cyclase (GGDEF)-like protein/PAS domain S-box-containing protein
MTHKKKHPVAAVPSPARSPTDKASASTVSLSALKEQAAGLRRAQLMANLAHVITRPDGAFESWSETLPELIGVKPEDIARSTRRWLDLIHPDDRKLFRETALHARTAAARADVEYRLLRGDKAWIYVRQVMEPIPGEPDSQGRTRWFNTLQDITAQKLAKERISRLNRVYAVLSGINALIVRVRTRDLLFHEACSVAVTHGGFRMAWIGLVDRDASRIVRIADAGVVGDFFQLDRLSLVEGTPQFGLCGQAMKSLKPAISQDVQRDPQIVRKKELAQRGINSICVVPIAIGGKGVGVMALYAPEARFFDDEEMRLLVDLAGDVSFAMEYIEKTEEAEYLAYYDPLTGLTNRTLFHERLEQALRSAAREQRRLALVTLDIERFRKINDTLGRHAGDELLKQIAERLNYHSVDTEWVARVGPDVFAIVVPDVPSEDELARRTEQRLRQLFGTPYRIVDDELRVSGKLGIALFPNDAADADALVRNAGTALGKAKRSGEGYLFYEQRMAERVSEHLALENKLRRALENDEFVLHYQPEVDLDTRSIVAVEALIRWQSSELGLVAPGRFIPLLEETGLIREVGTWALKRAALDHRDWVERGLAAPRIAVNLSAIQLRQRSFVRLMEEAIRGGVSPTGIDIELTESVVMDDIDANIEKLHALRRLGINIAIDDFGTGYSSLGYLAKLPVQVLKVDRSFIAAMQDDPNAMTLVSTIISLSHSLRLKVIAEGVETEEQARILRLLRCDAMQGFLISEPLPMERLAALLPKSA